MSIQLVKKLFGNRVILASLAVAGSIIGASLVQTTGLESVGSVWLATAVYMLGVLVAAWIMTPLIEGKGWLWLTAVLLALTIIFPGAILDTEKWVADQLPQLGLAASTLFIILAISMVEQSNQNTNKRWIITGGYVLIMLLLTFLL